MSSTNTPNMNLIVPVVGNEPGPTYAQDVNADLSIIDQHDHTTGNGVPITPAAINISSALTLNDNFLTSVAGVTLQAQLSTPAINTIYESGNDLFYVDGVGNNVRITQSGAVAGSPGSIANLVAPASASYVSGTSTFVWQSNTNIAANMDFGAAVMRNLSPNSTFGLTLQPPAALASNYTITLPSLPSTTKIMALTNSGVMSAPYSVDNSTIEISSNIIQVKDQGITAAKILNNTISDTQIALLGISTVSIANDAIQTAKIQNAAVTGAKIETNVNLAGKHATMDTQNIVVSNSNTTNGLGIIRGTVNSAASILAGEGFSIINNATGTYTITYNNAFSDTAVVIASISENSASNPTTQVITATSTGCVIFVREGGALSSRGFSFIALGQR